MNVGAAHTQQFADPDPYDISDSRNVTNPMSPFSPMNPNGLHNREYRDTNFELTTKGYGILGATFGAGLGLLGGIGVSISAETATPPRTSNIGRHMGIGALIGAAALGTTAFVISHNARQN